MASEPRVWDEGRESWALTFVLARDEVSALIVRLFFSPAAASSALALSPALAALTLAQRHVGRCLSCSGDGVGFAFSVVVVVVVVVVVGGGGGVVVGVSVVGGSVVAGVSVVVVSSAVVGSCVEVTVVS